MQKNSQDFSMQEALKFANSSAGQQLLALLQKTDADTLRKSIDQVKSGNMDAAKASLSQFLTSPEVKDLINQLGG